MLKQIVSTNLTKTLSFTYDYQGRRIEKKVWNNTTGTGTPATYLKYIYDGWNLIAELNAKNSNAVVRIYSWGPEAQGAPGTLRMIADNNGVYFPAYDPNGNVMGLVKASDGTVCAQYEYLPYGEQVTATGTMAGSNPIRFSTKYYDTEARLYYYGYRYYCPDMGRWLSRDPIEEQGGLNLYGFVNNDPVNKWDLWGMTNYTLGWNDPEYNDDDIKKRRKSWGSKKSSFFSSETLELYRLRGYGLVACQVFSEEYPDAAAHFRHFLGNSGQRYAIRLEEMLKVTSAKNLYEDELAEATNFIKNLKNPPGCRFSITSKDMSGGEIKEDENKNWYYAVHSYYAWGKGIVEICGDNPTLYFEYKFWDVYDWKQGEQFPIAFSKKYNFPISNFSLSVGIDFKGDIQADWFRSMHEMGIAQEFEMYGSKKVSVPLKKWK